MGVHTTAEDGVVALLCSTTGWAFGPIFDTQAEASSFLAYVELHGIEDLRKLGDDQIRALLREWTYELEQGRWSLLPA